jgi:ATP-dependent DNA helicase RecQ
MDEVIHTLLRSYTGLFTDYAYIDEALISTRSGVSRQEIYTILTGLSKCGIVSYIPQKKTPLIIYIRDREEQKYLFIPRPAYEERLKRFEKRISKVLEYMNEEHICRSRMLLRYFGEKAAKDCGYCDVCLAKSESGLNNAEFNEIREALLETLTTLPCLVRTLMESLPFPDEKSITAIRFLATHDERFILKDGYLSLKPDNREPDSREATHDDK